jgi:hypothetical protein
MVYSIVLTLHSFVRWVLVILAVVAVVRAFSGWLGKKEWTTLDSRLGVLLSSSADLQMLLGLILYIFLSPLTQAAFKDFGAAMSDPVLRYWGVEHIVMLFAAVVLIHIGQTMAKRAEAALKYKWVAIFLGLALLVMLVAIPWPFLPVGSGRPWIRL